MIKYDLKYGVSEVAKILSIDKKMIKDWAYHFSEYLNPKANPSKGEEREFTLNDLCTFGYISMYWEESPDFENIKYGLNTYSQFEYPYSEIAFEATPIFREFSEELINSNAWMIGGISEIADKISLADSYKLAGDVLIKKGIDDYNKDFIYPAIYNYRHATELYLKSIISEHQNNLPKNGKVHNLEILYKEVNRILKDRFGIIPPKWFENIVFAFNEFDPEGTTFRYGIKINNDEMFIDLHHIKKMMDWFSQSIHKVNNAKY
ncbi:MAG: hypothetical protein ABI554_03670 [Flavobacterium sp.]